MGKSKNQRYGGSLLPRLSMAITSLLWSSWMLRGSTPIFEKNAYTSIDSNALTATAVRRRDAVSDAVGRVGSKGRVMDTTSLTNTNSTLLKTKRWITSAEDTLALVPDLQHKPVIYIITPTYERLMRKVDLIGMSQALMLDGGVYWIMVEDTHKEPDMRLRRFLYETGLPFAHLTASAKVGNNHRGIPQRNAGLDVVHEIGLPGVVYFADDDNAYDHRLFEDLRTIKTVGIFPSAFSGGANYEACVLDWRGKITSFATNFPGREGVGERKFKVDMGGFAINIDMLKRQPEWRISDLGSGGHMETDMVEAFISSPAEADPVGRCAELRFWHMPKHEKWLIKKLAEVPKGAPKHYDLLASQFPPPPQKILLMTYAFGKEAVSNPFFRMFVESAKYSGVDIAIVGDSRPPFDLPHNVRHIQINWSELVERVSSTILDRPSLPALLKAAHPNDKAADFKPVFAHLFPEQVVDYDFWGYTDTDIVLGNVRALFPHPLLDRLDIFSAISSHETWGTFTLLRNTAQINQLFRLSERPLDEILGMPHSTCFAEWGGCGPDGRMERAEDHHFGSSLSGIVQTQSQAQGLRVELAGIPIGRDHACVQKDDPHQCAKCVFRRGTLVNAAGDESLLCHMEYARDGVGQSLRDVEKMQALLDRGEFQVSHPEGFDFILEE